MATTSAYPWYDSLWLTQYREARRILARERPDVLPELEAALQVFTVPADFGVRELPDLIDADTLAAIEALVLGFQVSDLALHETTSFGRFIVHDHPLVAQVHAQVVDLASEVAGEALEASYSFVSLYTDRGLCQVHLDAPPSKWTLDLCVRQSGPWPLHVSQPVPWPLALDDLGADWEARIREDPALRFDPYVLQPGGAVLFGGSAQWHYRDPQPGEGGRYCDLVFLHFIPTGTAELAQPERWADLFDAPELAGLAYAEQRVG